MGVVMKVDLLNNERVGERDNMERALWQRGSGVLLFLESTTG